MIDDIKGFADDVNRLREQSKLMESNEKAVQVKTFIVILYLSLLIAVSFLDYMDLRSCSFEFLLI